MPKSRKIRITITLILIILIVIIAIVLINNSKNKATPTSCYYNDPNKTYIRNESNCVINFLCIQGKVAFSDECGCGCMNA